MKKLAFLLVVVFGVTLFAGSAMAWDFSPSGKIKSITIDKETVYFIFEGDPEVCSTASSAKQVVVLNPTYKKEQLSLILAAQMSGKTIVVYGKNSEQDQWGCRVNVIRMQ